MRYRQLEAKVFRILLNIAITICLVFLASIVCYIAIKGITYIKLDLFSLKYTSENASVVPAIINTLIVVFFTLLISTVVGVCSAIYLNEYAVKENLFVKIIRIAIQTLQSTPSIVYGLFGTLLFVNVIFKGYSIISGIITLSIMVLPLIIISTEEALKVVPSSLKEGSYGLGAGKIRTIFKIILPSALPGIFSGITLSVGRVFGESAALIYTAGTVAQIATSYDSSGRTLAVHMFNLWNEGMNTEKSYATALVLLVIVIFINLLSVYIDKKLTKRLLGN